jgi:branched-chain amino acid transport system permease protein
MRYVPLNLARWAAWSGFALLLLVLPLVFRQGFALTLMTQMAIMVVFALSFNVLLGQTGLLSFGHAVYFGLGAYFAIHALNLAGTGRLPVPVTLVPLVGGVCAAVVALGVGWVTTRKAGVAFAMISLGIGEMVHAMSLMFPAFFGGEGGVNGNRVVGAAVLGIDYGAAIQVYYLVAAWTLVAVAAMFALTCTPLGRIANAVRDNEERAAFVGYDVRRVRLLMFVAAGFFAGIAGGLTAITYEIVTAETVSTARSGGVLVAAYIGGIGAFFGPILGAVVFTFFQSALSAYTKAWLLYLGIFFVGMVMFAPGGLALLLTQALRALRTDGIAACARGAALPAAAGVLIVAGTIGLVEMTYHVAEAGAAPQLALLGMTVEPFAPVPWIVCGVLLATGIALLPPVRRRLGGRSRRNATLSASTPAEGAA